MIFISLMCAYNVSWSVYVCLTVWCAGRSIEFIEVDITRIAITIAGNKYSHQADLFICLRVFFFSIVVTIFFCSFWFVCIFIDLRCLCVTVLVAFGCFVVADFLCCCCYCIDCFVQKSTKLNWSSYLTAYHTTRCVYFLISTINLCRSCRVELCICLYTLT